MKKVFSPKYKYYKKSYIEFFSIFMLQKEYKLYSNSPPPPLKLHQKIISATYSMASYSHVNKKCLLKQNKRKQKAVS